MITVNIGKRKQGEAENVVWNSQEIINPHWIVMGIPGMGKTYQLRNIATQLAGHKDVRIYVFDVHGDINMPSDITSSVKFSETTETGINPLKINPDSDSGGVRRRISAFISMINRYSRVLGEIQENVLSHLLEEFYGNYGFRANVSSTWGKDNKYCPTLSDFVEFVKMRMKSMVIGNSGKNHKALNSLCGKLQAMGKEASKPILEKDKDIMDKLKEDYLSAQGLFVSSMTTGKELDDYIKYGSFDVVKSVFRRMENLYNTGLFKNNPPSFDRTKPIWRFDIYNLPPESMGFLVELYIEKIFHSLKVTAKQKGMPSSPTTFIVLDEAHMFMSKEPGHILNVMAREARKFGCGLIFGSQNYTDFPEEIVTCCGTRLILGMDEKNYDRLGKMFGIKPGRFHYIQPRRTGLAQIKTHTTGLDNRFVDVIF